MRGRVCPVNHLVLIGFIMALKPLSAMELNPIKMTLDYKRREESRRVWIIIDESLTGQDP